MTFQHHRSGSSLAQEMASCLMTPSHYPKQCWLDLSSNMFCGIHLTAMSREEPTNFICAMCLESTHLTLQPHLPWASELIVMIQLIFSTFTEWRVDNHIRGWTWNLRHQQADPKQTDMALLAYKVILPKMQCGAAIMQSIFSKILPIDMP